ncbi:MAG: hypothetical protein HC828_08205 [Blastochloris sp.]|nr:hypothetical protein [Blastochloris sp.]
MQAYRIETTVTADGSLVINHLPLMAGEMVEVIILVQEQHNEGAKKYPLKGTPITYHNPTEPVAQDEWGALQ